MKRMSIASTFVFAFLIVFVSFSASQLAGKGWERTVTLSNGEVILDMSGEWDDIGGGYGIFSWYNGSPEIVTIAQEGNKFTAKEA